MKKVKLFVVVLSALALASCGSESKEQLSKKISADAIVLSGLHSDLLEVADSVTVMLIPTDVDEENWDVQVEVPLQTTTSWAQVPNAKECSNCDFYFTP